MKGCYTVSTSPQQCYWDLLSNFLKNFYKKSLFCIIKHYCSLLFNSATYFFYFKDDIIKYIFLGYLLFSIVQILNKNLPPSILIQRWKSICNSFSPSQNHHKIRESGRFSMYFSGTLFLFKEFYLCTSMFSGFEECFEK